MINIQQLKDVDSTTSQKSIPNRDSIKKFYIQPDSRTRVLDNNNFVSFVSETAGASLSESLNMISANKVTVNGDIIIDENFQLKSGDVVRIGVLGHFLQGPNNISIVK